MKKTINYHLLTTDKNTGYGKASVNMLEALKKTNNIINIVAPYKKHNPVADIDFFLRPPPWFIGKTKKKIAYFYWEATPFPDGWASVINTVDEIWAPCKLVSDCCKLSKFKGKVEIIPTPSIMPSDFNSVKKISIPNCDEDTFIFYSIFQWHNRKGWKELLKSYFDEFSNKENVVLIIKTNPIYHNLYDQILLDIQNIISQYNKKTPRLYLIRDIISEEQILSLHRTGHCYISTHRGEGWGMPIHDAIMFGKQIISTKFGGVTEFLDDDSFYPVEYELGPVRDMEWNSVYSESQLWAYPKISSIRENMRNAFQNWKENINKNILITKNIEQLSFDNVVKIINNLI